MIDRMPPAAIQAAAEAYLARAKAVAQESGEEPSATVIDGNAMARALEAALPHLKAPTMKDDTKRALAVLTAVIFVMLLIFCWNAGYGQGHQEALQSGYWHCVPNKPDIYASKKIYNTEKP